MRILKKITSVLLTALIVQSVAATETIMTTSAYQTDKTNTQTQVYVQESKDNVYGDFEYSVSSNKVTITKYTGTDTEVIIPSEIDNAPVTEIYMGAFAECENLINVAIPDSVKTIGKNAFTHCRYLQSISIPNGVTEIAQGTFSMCYDLTDVTIPESVTAIDDYAFSECRSLKNITVPSKVNYIGNNVFWDCKSLENIFVDNNNNSYSSLNGVLFDKNKTTLILYPQARGGEYSIPDTVTTIGSSAFYNCYQLTTVIIPDGVKTIGQTAFYNCTTLSSVNIPNSVTCMESAVFYNCSNLKSVTIPDSVTSLGNYMFFNCSQLTTVNLPNNIRSTGEDTFYKCGKLTAITIPNSITTIDNYAFYGCSGLTNITVPENVNTIGRCSFCDCSNLTSITLPVNIKSIDEYAFLRCDKLKDIYYSGTEEQWNSITVNERGNTALRNATVHYNCGITLNKTALTLGIGQTYTLLATVIPQTDNPLTWKSSNKAVITVNSKGKIVAKGVGKASVTVKTIDGKTAKCVVTIKKAPEQVTLNKTSATLGVKQTCTLTATLTPVDSATYCTWSSSDTTVATVNSSGRVVAKKTGTATITVKTSNGKTAACVITVKKAPTDISLNKTTLTLKKGQTETLISTLTPSTSVTYCNWSSSDTTIATVNANGVVTAKKKGTAVITVKTSNSKTASCTVTIV